MWATLDPTQPRPQVEAYEMNWSEAFGSVPIFQWKNLCEHAMLPDHSPDLVGPTTVPNDVTFVFEGERIDAKHKTIVDWDTRWFNLGCAGHTFMKMYLTGHVGAAESMNYITSREQRQAIMKMFAADYCGDGYAFTLPGVLLQRKDDNGWFSYTSPIASIEARWKAEGATCINIPRTQAHPTLDTSAKWPAGVMQEIKVRCPDVWNTRCPGPATDPLGHHLVTANQ